MIVIIPLTSLLSLCMGIVTVVAPFAGNVGVVSGIFSPKNDRHADMSAQCRRHDIDHVGDIAPCRLVGRRVGVVSARVNCDVSAHKGGGGNEMTTTTTAAAAETRQSNRHGRGEGMVTATAMATTTTTT
jgi:hypothetical protein